MALAVQGDLHTNKHKDLDTGATALQVGSGATTVYAIEVDNSGNTSAVYLRMYNLLFSSVSVGTTAPECVLKIPAGTKRKHFFNNGVGMAFATAMTIACLTVGGTAGSTGPTNDVTATLWTN